MTTTGLNIDILTNAINWAEDEKRKQLGNEASSWNQGTWHEGVSDNLGACGTSFCLAGWIAVQTLAPDEVLIDESIYLRSALPVDKNGLPMYDTPERYYRDEATEEQYDQFNAARVDGEVCDRAMEALGAEDSRAIEVPLKPREHEGQPWTDSGYLFSGGNTIRDVRLIAERLAGRKIRGHAAAQRDFAKAV